MSCLNHIFAGTRCQVANDGCLNVNLAFHDFSPLLSTAVCLRYYYLLGDNRLLILSLKRTLLFEVTSADEPFEIWTRSDIVH